MKDSWILYSRRKVEGPRQTVEDLRQECELLEELLESQPVGVYRIRVRSFQTWSPEDWASGKKPPYSLELVSKRLCEILGVERPEFEASSGMVNDLVHPDDKAEFVRLNTEANLCLAPFRWEGRLLVRGEVRWIRFESLPKPQENGDVVWTGVLQDVTDQRRLQEELKRTRERFDFALQAADAGTWEWDLESNTNTWSDQLWGLYGLEPHSCQPSYEAWRKTIHPEDLEMVEEMAHHAVTNGADLTFEYRVNLPDGGERWLMSRGRPMRDDQGRVTRYLGVIIDITDRKRLEDVQLFLARKGGSEAGTDFLHELARYLSARLDMEFVCIDRLEGEAFSARTEAVFHDGQFIDNQTYALKDTPCGEVVKKELCLFPRDICKLFPNDTVLRDMKAESYAGITLWGKDDQPIGLIAVIGRKPKPDLRLAESVLRLVSVRASAEIERRISDEKLRKSESQVRSKLDSLLKPEGDIGQLDLADVIDPKAIQALMDEFYRLTRIGIGIVDLSGKVLVGTGWQEICTRFHRAHPETLKHCLESDRELSRGGVPGTFKQYRCKNNMWDMVTPIVIAGKHLGNLFLGQFFFDDEVIDREAFRTQARKYGFDEGEYLAAIDRVPRWSRETVNNVMSFYARFAELIGSLSFSTIRLARALSDRERLQDQLVQSQKMEAIGRLAGGVAHDFNNMLGVILGNVDFALSGTTPENPVYKELQEIERAARRSANLTRQLLAFARKQTIRPKVLDLNETVSGMLEMLTRLVGENIRIDWKPQSGVETVSIDPTQIDQIVVNLVVNARDAIRGQGTITIETKTMFLDPAAAGRYMDTPPGRYLTLVVSDDGIGMDEATRKNVFEPFFTTKDGGRGTGLGLATVYGIIKQNQGFIEVVSEPGKGSRFTVGFLCHRGEAPRPAAPALQKIPRGNGETILLVEDEPMLLDLSRAMLKKLGYEVLAAEAPQDALELLEKHAGNISLLFTDVIMPGMNGTQLAQKARQIVPGLECLFMSGYTYDTITHQGLLEDGVPFLHKPFMVEELAAQVARSLKKT